ncbi:glutamate--cysteine ligase [Kocuria sp. LUK]|uniref:Putative glutamate--cysteine ligase 2 n=1 Tax=Kocuria flava TaxID=446860 RepID=A0A2N4T283_9MICC|nr:MULTISPECIES: glutamate--cysteine ligase [Kocuria]MCD1146422.1 glutamate--cysteine ligase [Kocuria sp. LUK]PLC12332.1 carboxylate--amine ligase [Kocuria flava]
MEISFARSDQSTLGVEWEVALVDAADGDLVPRGRETYEAVLEARPEWARDGDHPHLTGEFLLNTIEMVTGVCRDVAGTTEQLALMMDEIRAVADPRGLEIFAAGTHPFARWQDQQVTDKQRYHKLVDRTQYWGRQMVIFGVHVHVGLDSRAKALPVLDGMLAHYPHLLALSANSPFWDGQDTGYASQRSMIFQQLSTAGLPYPFDTWDEYERCIEDMIATGIIEEISECRWDVRPVPRLGTNEVRFCDGLSTLWEVGALTALTQCLAHSLAADVEAGRTRPRLQPWHVRENKWRAARYGLDAQVITDAQNTERDLREDLERLLDRLEPVAARLGCARELADVERIYRDGAGYQRQRDVARAHDGDLRAVALDIVRRTRENA